MTIEALSAVSEEKYNVGHKNKRNLTQEQLNKLKSAVLIPMWNQGDKYIDTSLQHDSYGIIKNKDQMKYSGVPSTWENGSLATNTSSNHDSDSIVLLFQPLLCVVYVNGEETVSTCTIISVLIITTTNKSEPFILVLTVICKWQSNK